jgi:hypothetical protein
LNDGRRDIEVRFDHREGRQVQVNGEGAECCECSKNEHIDEALTGSK